MHYIHGSIGCVLVVLALIHVPYPEPLAWLPYTGAAILAFLTLLPDISVPVSRLLAIATAAVMFFFFAAFFLMVSAVTFQLRGWLAALMSNPRRRAAVGAGLVVAFMLTAFLPSVLEEYLFDRRGDDRPVVTEPLAGRCTGASIDREERKGRQPSDHAPVVVELDV